MTTPITESQEILVVDDNINTARALGELLMRAGFEPAVFANGIDALKYLDIGKPSAAVVDIHLPDISGLALSQFIRDRRGAELPIIIISGDACIENVNALNLVGATYFYSKPVRAHELVNRLRTLLAAKVSASN